MLDPGVVVGVVDATVKTAERAPLITFAVIAIVVPLLVLGGIALLVTRSIIPTWTIESALNRKHISDIVAQRGKEANEDLAKEREVSQAKHDSIVQQVGSKIDGQGKLLDRIVDKLDRISDSFSRLALKAALPIGLFMGGVLFGAALLTVIEESAHAADCPKGCSAGWHCCSSSGACCEDQTATARRLALQIPSVKR